VTRLIYENTGKRIEWLKDQRNMKLIGVVTESVLSASVVDRKFESRPGQS